MTTPMQSRLVKPVTDADHSRGSEMALVTLLEYGDYECPFCARAHPIIQALEAAMGDRMRFVFRNFPLTQIHPHAQSAAEAAGGRRPQKVLADARHAVREPARAGRRAPGAVRDGNRR